MLTQTAYRRDKYKFLHTVSIYDREVYDYYRENRIKVAKGINDYNLYKKAVSGLMLVIRDMFLDSDGGVYIDNFGYLCFIMSGKKGANRLVKSRLLRKKKVPLYTPWFFKDDLIKKELHFLPWDKREKKNKPKKFFYSTLKHKKEIQAEIRKMSKNETN